VPQFEPFAGNPDQWDDLIDAHGGASAYQYSPFNLADRHLFTRVCDETGAIGCAVLISSPILGLPGKVLTIHRGPAGNVPATLDALESWARDQSVWCIEVTPDDVYDETFRGNMQLRGWQATGGVRHTLRLDLTQDEDVLLAGIESRGRYQVKRAAREGISVRQAESHDDIGIFCDLMADMAKEKGLASTSRERLTRVGEYLVAHPTRGTVLVASHGGMALGANMLWRSGARVENIYGASRKQKVAVGYPLQWASILWAKSTGSLEYDFGGFDPTADGGPALMKRAFCRNSVPLSPSWRKVLRPRLFSAATTVRRLLRRSSHEVG
jgi:hypothetical protein